MKKNQNYDDHREELIASAQKSLENDEAWNFDKTVKYIKETQSKEKIFKLEIHVGNRCNFDCGYCVVSHWNKMEDRTKLKEEHINKIPEFLDKYANKEIDSIRVVISGGEPSLPFYNDTVLNVIDTLCDYTVNRLGKRIQFEINTNGYSIKKLLLSIVEREQKYGSIFLYRIPIDGTKEIHDSRRVLYNKKNSSTYERIVNNVKLILNTSQGRVMIRTNVDQETLPILEDLWIELKNEDILIDKYIERIKFDLCLTFIPRESQIPNLWSRERYEKWLSVHIESTLENITYFNCIYIKFLLEHYPNYLRFICKNPLPLPLQIRSCEIGERLFVMIHANGDYSFCNELQFLDPPKFGSLNDCDYDEKLIYLLSRTVEDMELCKTCDDVFSCAGMCPMFPTYYFRNPYLPACGKIKERDYNPAYEKEIQSFLDMNPQFETFIENITPESFEIFEEEDIVTKAGKNQFASNAILALSRALLENLPQ